MKKAIVRTLFTSFALLAIAGSAEENIEGENVVVNSRPLSPEKQERFERERIAESEQMEDLSPSEEMELSVLRIPILPDNYLAVVAQASNHTGANLSSAIYQTIDYFPQDNVLKTQDGAEWTFDTSDALIVRTWNEGDTVVITPKGRWFWGSNYSYILTNKRLGESIDVNLFLGPVAFGNQSSWIVGIDRNLGQIYMLNGQGERSVWEISNVDLYLFDEWTTNDSLLVGQNDSWLWWFSSFNHILVNVNSNHYVRARKVTSDHHCRHHYAA